MPWLIAAAWSVASGLPAAADGATQAHTIEVGGLTRTYLMHVPPSLPAGGAPLVLVFHGGGGDGPGTERLTRFSELADREGLLVAYPEGIGRNWYDGREFTGSRAHRERIDDVFRVYDIAMLGRESIEGHDTIAVSLTPRPNASPRSG